MLKDGCFLTMVGEIVKPPIAGSKEREIVAINPTFYYANGLENWWNNMSETYDADGTTKGGTI